jgi:hypothetical protein
MKESKYAKDYTLTELMIVCGARELRDWDVTFIGADSLCLGISNIALSNA